MTDAQSPIRAAVPADLDAILALYADFNRREPPPEETLARASWARLLATPGITVLVHALPDGLLTATCTLLVVPNLTRGSRPWAIIENVITLAEHRGRGHGKAVVRAAIAAAGDAGCYKVSLTTGGAESTQRFYESAGLTRGGKTYFETRWT